MKNDNPPKAETDLTDVEGDDITVAVIS